MTVYDLLVDFTIASALILVGQFLRAKIKFFQEFFMPASMIAGCGNSGNASANAGADTNTDAPRLSVMAFNVQAKVRIRIAGTIALNPSGIHAIESVNFRTLLSA